MTYVERRAELFRLKRESRGDLIAAFNCLMGSYKEGGARLLEVHSLRMRDGTQAAIWENPVRC